MEPLNTIEPIGIRESPRIILFTSIIQNGLNLLGVSPYAFKMVIGAFILFAISSSNISFRRLLRTS